MTWLYLLRVIHGWFTLCKKRREGRVFISKNLFLTPRKQTPIRFSAVNGSDLEAVPTASGLEHEYIFVTTDTRSMSGAPFKDRWFEVTTGSPGGRSVRSAMENLTLIRKQSMTRQSWLSGKMYFKKSKHCESRSYNAILYFPSTSLICKPTSAQREEMMFM